MRKFPQILTLLLASAAALAQTPASPAVSATKPTAEAVLTDGTPVKLRVGPGVNVMNFRMGDELGLDVVEDVRVEDVPVITAGSVAKTIVMSQSLDTTKTGKVLLSLRFVTLVDGEKIALRSSREHKAAVSTVVTGSDGDVTITTGGEITAYTTGNLSLDLSKMHLANQPTNELNILTVPTNAEVSVDGKVMGSTPFAGRVVRGEHVVAVRMAGFQPWSGTVRVSAEPANLKIALKKQDGLETVPEAATAPTSLGDLARAARARKDGPKAPGEPLELLPGETRPTETSSDSGQTTSQPAAAAPSAAAAPAVSGASAPASTPAAAATAPAQQTPAPAPAPKAQN